MNNLYTALVVIVGLLTTALLLRFILSSSDNSKEIFEAIDGTRFSYKKDLDEYELLYAQFKCLYDEESSPEQRKQKAKLGLTESFTKQLKADGFRNLNLFISNKEQFKRLAELFKDSEISSD